MNKLLDWITSPTGPMFVAAGLYGLICLGWVLKDRPWFGGMWLCYGVAIGCMYMDSK